MKIYKKALDLCCCGGGASLGLAQAGFEVVGVDKEKNSHYPFEFILSDVLDLSIDFLRQFDFIWASPPCQTHTSSNGKNTKSRRRGVYADIIDELRIKLDKSGVPYCMENVIQAPLRKDLILDGSMFDLPIVRKRIFEIKGFKVPQLESKKQTGYIYTITGDTPNSSERKKRIDMGLKQQPTRIEWQRAMGGLWHIKSKNHISEAIPPQYSKYIVEHLETNK